MEVEVGALNITEMGGHPEDQKATYKLCPGGAEQDQLKLVTELRQL